jgi:hypothetical protein
MEKTIGFMEKINTYFSITEVAVLKCENQQRLRWNGQ